MLELYLRAEAPALAEVIPNIDDGMRNIKASVAGVVLMLFGLTVAAYVVAEVVAREYGLAIAAHAQSLSQSLQTHK